MKRDHDTTAHRAKTIRRLTARSVIKFDRRAIMLTVACVLVHLLSLSPSARAHPHAWIDLRSTVHLNGDGQIVGIEQEWLFDNFYTLFVIESANRNAVDQKKALTHLAETNLKNLRAYDYYTEVRVGGKKVTFNTVTEFDSELRGDKLWMRFLVPLSEPVDASASQVSYAVYDPTYYVEILHLKDDVVAFRGSSKHRCGGRILAPNPTMEAVTLAQALDRQAPPDSSLGRMFAEQVDISCR